ncbi:energy transducer TonB [Pacificimonas sp. ICDLI1SI03]
MSFIDGGSDRKRDWRAALAVAVLHVLIVLVLLQSAGVVLAPEELPALDILEVPEKPPEPEGAPAAPEVRLDPIPVIVPPPDIEVELPPPPIRAAPPSGGEADGVGSGSGTGQSGSGSGGGGISRAQKIAGDITNRDYPRATRRTNAEGVVEAFFDIRPDGRVENCQVTSSSGNAALDETTCRLITERFRYEPARNERGEPVGDRTGWRQSWWRE